MQHWGLRNCCPRSTVLLGAPATAKEGQNKIPVHPIQLSEGGEICNTPVNTAGHCKTSAIREMPPDVVNPRSGRAGLISAWDEQSRSAAAIKLVSQTEQ